MAGDRRRRRPLSGGTCALVACALILVACTDPSATTTTTTTTSVAVDTVAEPDPSTTTTTTLAEDPTVNICGRGTIWEAGVTYVAPCFLVPLAIVAPGEGWRTPRTTLEAMEGFWVAPGEREPAIRYVVLAYLPNGSPQESIESILTIDGVHLRNQQSGASDHLQVNVETDPKTNFEPEGECVLNVAAALHLGGGGEPGYVLLDLTNLMDGAPQLYGLGACRLFRIWALPVDDITVTVVATTDDLDRFDELMPTMEQLVDSIAVATP